MILRFFFTTPITFFNKVHALAVLANATNAAATNITVNATSLTNATFIAVVATNVATGPAVADAVAVAAEQQPGMSLLQDLATLGEGWPAFVRRAVFDYLPSLIIVAMNLVLLALMELPARSFEKKVWSKTQIRDTIYCFHHKLMGVPCLKSWATQHLHSEIERSIGWRTYLFLVVNMLILPSLAMDAASSVVWSLFDGDGGSGNLLGAVSTSDNSAYFATIVLQAAFVSVPYQLLRTHEHVFSFFNWSVCCTPSCTH